MCNTYYVKINNPRGSVSTEGSHDEDKGKGSINLDPFRPRKVGENLLSRGKVPPDYS